MGPDSAGANPRPDLGADVIKVEPSEGDLLRASGGAMGNDKRMGPIYLAANRNKRSICLDLKKPGAVAVVPGRSRRSNESISEPCSS